MRRVDSFEKIWCWEGLGAGGEGDNRGWDGWRASPTRCTWVWVNSGSWWWTGRPGVLQFMGSQRVRHDWATELNYLLISPVFSSWLLDSIFSYFYLFVYVIANTLLSLLLQVYTILVFPGGSDSKESACNVGDPSSIPGLGRSPGEGNGYPLQYSCLENPMDRTLAGYSPCSHKESYMTEQLTFSVYFLYTALDIH